MVLSAVYLLDEKGKVLISRNYRGDVPPTAVERFRKRLHERDGADVTPVFVDGGVTFAAVKHNNVYLLGVTKSNSNVAMMLVWLRQLVTITKEYFGALEEESIRDNFVILYELLDETMDFGYPQVTDAAILKQYITQEGLVLEREKMAPPQAVTNVVSWRSEGIVHKKNEVFLDVVEKVNVLVASNGNVLSSEILGAVKLNTRLTGMPELKLGLNDKVMLAARGRRSRGKSVELEDVQFHQCVRLSQFERDRTISFIPPDGEFQLMQYRLNTTVKPMIWVEAVVERRGRSRLDYSVKARSQFRTKSVANNIDIFIPVPPDVDSPAFKTNLGRVTYVPDLDAIKWSINQLYGGREVLMRARFGLPSVEAEDPDAEKEWKKPIRIKFELPYFTASGLQVRYLKVTERSGYQALPWVRYMTESGDYQLRMS